MQGLKQHYDAFIEDLKRQNLFATGLAELLSVEEIGVELEQFLRS